MGLKFNGVLSRWICEGIFFVLMIRIWHLFTWRICIWTWFMATDPVTGSQTNKGNWIYGFLSAYINYDQGIHPAYPEGRNVAI